MADRRDFRMTRQRRTILEELEKLRSHPSADEVYERVRHKLPKISLGTVYRNLEVLCEQGLINKLEIGGSQRRYDANRMEHYHVRCIGCGQVEDFPLEPFSVIEDELRGRTDYEILGHHVEFFGRCPKCKKMQGNVSPEA